MSGSYSMKGTQPKGVGVKKGSLATNGSGPPPLSYPADPPDDENMNEIMDDSVDLTVLLPDGTMKQQSVDSNIPMMDLLVRLAASNKLNPASHTLVVQTGDKWKQIDFKANKTIGLLAGEDRQVSVQIVEKRPEDKVRPKSTAQPFEMTYRFTVNLPQNQKKVLRISPKVTLGEIREILCREKNFDPSRYVFLLPNSPDGNLDDSVSVGDLKTSEISFVSVAMIDAAASRSMSDLAFAAAQTKTDVQDKKEVYMPSTGEKKAKKGFLSFLGKKDKKFKPQQDTDIERRTLSRNMEFTKGIGNTEKMQMRPKSMYADSGELEHFGLRKTTGDLHRFSEKAEFRKSTGSAVSAESDNVVLATLTESVPKECVSAAKGKRNSAIGAPPKKSAKKRAAPLPPSHAVNAQKPKKVQVEIDVHSNITPQARIEDIHVPDDRVQLKKNHSRNSSDSSGYHELTVSGAESPDASKANNLQTTLDTTSIDSNDHFNGDSGVRDMSPLRGRSAYETQGSGSRDSSLDPDRPPVAPGRKKKRAPLPPPGMSSNIKQSIEDKPSQQKPDVPSPTKIRAQQQDEEFEALKAMEEVTMKFNIEDSDDDEDKDEDLHMVETSSVHSEDVEVDLHHRQQPPVFKAPPPPTEPPPEDTEPVDVKVLMNQVDKIDIGVGEDTTSMGPDSNTNSPSKELKKAMPEFKEKMLELVHDSGEEEESSYTSQTSKQDNESDQSFIIHDADTKEKLGPETLQGNRDSSEITYDFKVDEVPADFQNEKEKEYASEKVEEEESEESFYEEETVEFYPAPPPLPDEGSPRRIPDLESPKEHKVFAIPAHEFHTEIPLDVSTPKPSSADEGRKGKNEVSEQEPKVEEQPKEKEEFVLTLDELSNVDFSASEPGEEKKVKNYFNEPPKRNYRIAFRSSLDYDPYIENVTEPEISENVQQEPVFYEDNNYVQDENMNFESSVKGKCSDLSFSPHNEEEQEHVLEDKSISLITLPAERMPVCTVRSENGADGVSAGASDTFASSTRIVLSGSQSSGSAKRESSPGSESSPRSDDSFDSNSLLQAQYNQLQQQFQMWQNQLTQNQKLLASSSEVSSSQKPGREDQSNLQLQQLQLQIQMQQQMMFQLQQSMQALALQNTLNQKPPVSLSTFPSQTDTVTPPSTQVFTIDNEKYRPPSPVVETIQTQTQLQAHAAPQAVPDVPAPPPPVVTSNPKTSKADTKYTKPKQKRLERQLDPREQLMLDIRNFGKTGLKKVPVKATNWHK